MQSETRRAIQAQGKALSHVVEALEATARAVEDGRADVARLIRDVQEALRASTAAEHATSEALRRVQASLDLVLGEVRAQGKRLAACDERISALESRGLVGANGHG